MNRKYVLIALLTTVFSLHGMLEIGFESVDIPDSRPESPPNGPGFLIPLNTAGSVGPVAVYVVPAGTVPQPSTTPSLYSATVGQGLINFEFAAADEE